MVTRAESERAQRIFDGQPVDFDSRGVAWGDVEEFDSVGNRKTVRRKLSEDEVLSRMAQSTNADNVRNAGGEEQFARLAAAKLQRDADSTQKAQAHWNAVDQGQQLGAADMQAEAEQLYGSQGHAISRALDAGRRNVRVRNPNYESTKQFIDTTTPLNEQEIGDQQAVDDAKIAEQRQVADQMAQMERDRDMRLVDQQAEELARNERAEAQMRAVQEADAKVTEAAEAMRRQPDVDPERYWSSRTAGQKFLAVIGGLAAGFAGIEPHRHLKAAIAEDIEAQRANIDKRETEFQEAKAGAASERHSLAALQDHFGDERAAELAYSIAREENAMHELQRVLAEAGIHVMTAEQQQFMTDLQQSVAADRMRLQQMAAVNVPFHTRTVQTIGPNEARYLQRAGDKALDQAAKAGQMSLDTRAKTESEAQKQRGRLQLEGAKQAGARAAAAESRQDEKISGAMTDERMRKARKVMDRITNFRNKYDGDVPGRGAGTYAWGDGATVEKELEAIVEDYGRLQSGGVIGEEERESFREQILGGVTDDRLMKNLDVIMSGLESEMETVARSMTDEQRRRYTAAGLLPRMNADLRGFGGGAGQASVVQED